MVDSNDPMKPAPDRISPYLVRSPRSLQQVQRQRERQRQLTAGRIAPSTLPEWAVTPAEMAALIDLGMSDAEISSYLLVDLENVANLRSFLETGAPGQATIGRAGILERAFRRLSVAEMRDQARLLAAEARSEPEPVQRRTLAERAFELAQLAEATERRSADKPPAPGTRTAEANNGDEAAQPLERARRWRMRAEEYRVVAEAVQSPSARETYIHLARSYETLAEQFEFRAALSSRRTPGAV